jgi:L-cysteine/cystine lyase
VLRAEFPVLDRIAYLNAGTDGPVPAAAAAAACAELEAQAADGRWTPHFERRFELLAELRAGYAEVLGCPVEEVTLTASTSTGLGAVLAGLDLGPGDEIVTSDHEHPGLLGPLKVARDRGVEVRMVPLADIPDAVSATTTLVACSHVDWIAGARAPDALAGLGVPVVLDGAQGAGAVPVDVKALGCAAYAASGQKWLCGADGTGMLYIEPGFRERVRAIAPGYLAFADPSQGLDAPLHVDGRRYDAGSISREAAAFSLASLQVLRDTGLEDVHARARTQAEKLAGALAERGHTVAPRSDTTLVAWEDAAPVETRARLAEQGIVLRDLPGTSLLRASVGAWNDDGDVERLLAAL